MLRQLTDQDAGFLYAETPETPMHVGSLSLVELPEGYRGDFFANYKAHIASRVRLVPFMHSRLASVPFDLDRPFWVEDEQIDLDQHIRHITVPKPGRMADLEALVAALHATVLDRSRPLWQLFLVDGLESDQLAIYAKMHHAAMDGASSQAMIDAMYDPSPTPRTLSRPEVPEANNRGNTANILKSLLGHRVQQAIRAVQYVPEMLQAITHLALPDPKTLKYRPIASWPRAPATLLNVGITNQRTYAARTLPLPEIKQLARQTGTKVNDVILAICSGALSGYLADKSGLPNQPLSAMVPVSLPDPTDPQGPNHNGLFLCSLANNIADPYQRLLAIRRSSVEQKKRLELFKQFPLPDITLPGVGAIVRRLVALYGRSRLVRRPPLLGNLTISNVPGPTTPLYIVGARLVSIFPCSIAFHGQALNITVESYGDRLDVGLIACAKAVPDLAQLADRLAVSLAALQQAVSRSLPAARLGAVLEDRSGRADRIEALAKVHDVAIAAASFSNVKSEPARPRA